jgi:hypothetical protein
MRTGHTGASHEGPGPPAHTFNTISATCFP